MAEIIGVRFKNVGKIYYFDPAGLKIERGSHVIVETARGVECGTVAVGNREVDDSEVVNSQAGSAPGHRGRFENG